MFQQEFQRTMRAARAAEEKIEALWNAIREQYGSPDRYYHNLSHLDQVILQLLPVKGSIRNWTAVVLATAYHDYVYDPSRTDNEEQSALRAQQDLSPLVDAASLAWCLQMIRATKAHLAGTQADVNFFIDADLSILGASADHYRIYARQIRKEYGHLNDVVFWAGRKTVLQRLLLRQRIFSTAPFYTLYEAAARRNLQAEYGRPDDEAGRENPNFS